MINHATPKTLFKAENIEGYGCLSLIPLIVMLRRSFDKCVESGSFHPDIHYIGAIWMTRFSDGRRRSVVGVNSTPGDFHRRMELYHLQYTDLMREK